MKQNPIKMHLPQRIAIWLLSLIFATATYMLLADSQRLAKLAAIFSTPEQLTGALIKQIELQQQNYTKQASLIYPLHFDIDINAKMFPVFMPDAGLNLPQIKSQMLGAEQS